MRFEEALQAMREGEKCCCKETSFIFAIKKVRAGKDKWEEQLMPQSINGNFEVEEPLWLSSILAEWEIVDD